MCTRIRLLVGIASEARLRRTDSAVFPPPRTSPAALPPSPLPPRRSRDILSDIFGANIFICKEHRRSFVQRFPRRFVAFTAFLLLYSHCVAVEHGSARAHIRVHRARISRAIRLSPRCDHLSAVSSAIASFVTLAITRRTGRRREMQPKRMTLAKFNRRSQCVDENGVRLPKDAALDTGVR